MRMMVKTVLAGAMMCAGFGCHDNKPETAKPMPEQPKASAEMKPMTPAAPPAATKGSYFEVPGKDGKTTYLFGSPESMQAYMKDGKLPEMKMESIKGQPVSIESSAADRLKKEYESQHK